MKVYLDNAATTKPHEAVAQAIFNEHMNNYGNPSSLHTIGRHAGGVVEDTRDIIAKTINCAPSEIYFTSGATEADNIAILGVANNFITSSTKHIISTKIEHPAVLEALAHLQTFGFEIDYLSVDKYGVISLDEFNSLLRDDTILVSIMHVNNELGTIQPIEKIANILKNKKTIFHTDAVQSYLKLPIDVRCGIDLLTASAHKIYGPKGIGFLYKNKGVVLKSPIFGGKQEQNVRSGTINAPLIKGFGIAVMNTKAIYEQSYEHIDNLKRYFYDELKKINQNIELNGQFENIVATHLNVFIPNITSDILQFKLDLDGIYASSGSACSAGTLGATHVIKAINKDLDGASIRFSLSHHNTKEEIDYTIEKMKKIINT